MEGGRDGGSIEDGRIYFAFDRDIRTISISDIIPLKSLPDGARHSKKFALVLSSVKSIGLVEAPVVIANTEKPGSWFLVDGHLRLEVLKELGILEVECLVGTDDDTYTYNKRVNRLAPIQEHRMIARAIQRGVPAADIADALGFRVEAILRRFRLLDGISSEAAEILKDAPCSMAAIDVLRQLSAVRQIEAADLMIGQHNFSVTFARAIRAATPEHQLASPRKEKKSSAGTPSRQQIARMERELAALQIQVRNVEDTYGIDNLHLTVACGYIGKMLSNGRVSHWLERYHQEYLGEFQKIAEIQRIAPLKEAGVTT